MNDFKKDFNNQIDDEAQRAMLVSIRDEIRQLKESQAATHVQLCQFMESETKNASMARDVTQIANKGTLLIEDMHLLNAKLAGVIEGLTMYLRSDAALNRMIDRATGVSLAMDEQRV